MQIHGGPVGLGSIYNQVLLVGRSPSSRGGRIRSLSLSLWDGLKDVIKDGSLVPKARCIETTRVAKVGSYRLVSRSAVEARTSRWHDEVRGEGRGGAGLCNPKKLTGLVGECTYC